MKKLLASLLFLLSVFIFSADGTKAADINCDDSSQNIFLGGKEKCLQVAPFLNAIFKNDKNGPWYSQTPTQFSAKVFGGSQDEIFGERYTYAQINWIVNSLATMLNPAQNISTPGDLFNLFKAIQSSLALNRQNKNPYLDTKVFGPFAFLNNGLSFMYLNPPASGIDEAKKIASKFDLTSPAMAQGYGYNGLGSGGAVKELWNASKNVAFFFMVLLLIVSGFLIMFRVKINPQTVISIQTMIPKLIITLVLVLFSFAIAGFLIDLVYILIGIFVSLLVSAKLAYFDFKPMFDYLTDPYFWNYFMQQNIMSMTFGLILFVLVGASGLFFGGGGVVATLPIGAIIGVVVMAASLIISFKIYYMLIKSYVSVLLQIAFAPLQIMMDLIPGQQGFGPWVRGLVANLSVFVVVPIMFTVQNILGHVIDFAGQGGSFKFVKDWGDLGGSNLNLPMTLLTSMPSLDPNNIFIRFIIGFVIFSMTPKVADMVRDFLKVPAFKYGAGLMDEAMAGLKVKGGVERHQKESEADALQRAKVLNEGGGQLAPGARGIIGGFQEARGAYNKAAAKDKSAETSAAYSAGTASIPTDTRAFSGGASATPPGSVTPSSRSGRS